MKWQRWGQPKSNILPHSHKNVYAWHYRWFLQDCTSMMGLFSCDIRHLLFNAFEAGINCISMRRSNSMRRMWIPQPDWGLWGSPRYMWRKDEKFQRFGFSHSYYLYLYLWSCSQTPRWPKLAVAWRPTSPPAWERSFPARPSQRQPPWRSRTATSTRTRVRARSRGSPGPTEAGSRATGRGRGDTPSTPRAGNTSSGHCQA